MQNLTEIEIAAIKQDWPTVMAMAKTKKTDAQDNSRYGAALFHAVFFNQKEAVEVLLKAKAQLTWSTVETKNYAQHCAALNKNTEILELLIQHGADLSVKNKAGKTPIQIAAENQDWPTVMAMAKTKKTDAQDNSRYGAALFHAVFFNQKEAVEVLLKAKAQLTWSTVETKNYAQHCAALNKNTEILELLIQHGADLSVKNKAGKTPIQIAAENQDWPTVMAIAKSKKTDPEDSLCYGRALLDAVCFNQIEVVEVLLKANAPFSWRYDDAENYPQHCAALNKNTEILELLIQHGADLSVKNKAGKTPIQIAAENQDWPTVMAIAKSKKTDPEDSLCYGRALLDAVCFNQIEVVEVLLKANAPFSWRYDDAENYPQHCAALNKNTEILELLIQHGADLSVKNKAGKTPIQIAAENQDWPTVMAIAKSKKTDPEDSLCYGSALLDAVNCNQIEVVEALLKAKAPISWRYVDAKNYPQHCAVIHKNIEMLKLLIQHGADLSLKNKTGETPLEIAINNENWSAIELFAKYRKYNKNNDLSFNYEMALFTAFQHNQDDVVEALLIAGAEICRFCATYFWWRNQNAYLFAQQMFAEHFSQISDSEKIFPPGTIDKVISETLSREVYPQQRKHYEKLCFEIGSYYFNSDLVSDYVHALTFFALSGNSSEIDKLKVNCLLGLSGIFVTLPQTELSPSDLLTKDNPVNGKPVLIDQESINLLIQNLIPHANDNDEINNFLGELYFYSGNYEEAFKYWKIARKTTKQAAAHIQTTLKNKLKADHPLAESLEIEILHIEMENKNEIISTTARAKLVEYYFKKGNLEEAKKYATTASLKKKLFNYYFDNNEYEAANFFAVTPYARLKLSKKYFSMGKCQEAARLAYSSNKKNSLLSLHEKKLFLIPEARVVLDQNKITEIMVAYQDDAEFISTVLLKELIAEDKNQNQINETALTVLKHKSLLAKMDGDLAIIYFCDPSHSDKLTPQDKKDFLLNFMEVHPEFSLDSVIYEDIQHKLTTEFDEHERSRFLKTIAINLSCSKIAAGELEKLQLIIGETYFKKTFTEIVALPFVQQKTKANDNDNDNLSVKSIYAHILLNKNNPDYEKFISIFSEENPKVDELYVLYGLIDHNKSLSSLDKYEWKGILKRFAIKIVNEQTKALPVYNKIEEFNKATQQNLFSDNRLSYLDIINHKTNAVMHLETLKSAHELEKFSEKQKLEVIQEITKNYSPRFFSSVESKALFEHLKDSKIGVDNKIKNISTYLKEENSKDGKLINHNKKLFNVIKSNVEALSVYGHHLGK